jgi:RNA exonuclease NGL2
MLISELTHLASQSDILCLQEVDRLPSFFPYLSHTHSASSAKAPKKQHGLVILHREAKFEKRAERVVHLDEEFVHEEGKMGEGGALDARGRRGGTRETKNIGLLVALERKDGTGEGVVRSGSFFVSLASLLPLPIHSPLTV